MKTFFTFLGVLIGLGLAAAWFFTLGPARVETVTVATATRGPAVEAVYATGTVEASVMLPIAARITARLMELSTDEGHDVTEGQVLARLEDADLQKTLEELRAREVFIRKDYDRKAALAKSGYETKSSLDQARAELDAIRASIARTKAEADYSKLISPAAGTVIRRDGEIGQMIPANQPVFWLRCCAPLRISAEVDEEDIARVKPGQKVLIRADAFPDAVYHGTVEAITPKGDPVSRSYRVRITLAESTPLQIGMTAENNIIISEKDDVLLLPNNALIKDYVFAVDNNHLRKITLKTGIQGTDRTEILGGLDENTPVVLNPETTWTDGQRVHMQHTTETAQEP